MITKTLNLDDAYTKLFDEIRQKSSGAIDINNVEGFFGNIIEISALEDGKGKKYLRLPLDEPMFEIDANTRKITVPNDFKSNGLSVQGDHLAETVYFVIDRYFDYMDLNNTSVTINWKMGSESGKTKKFTMSTDVIPGCIVFGWPIDNVLTQKSGTLTFAVEFSRKTNGDEGDTLYDFNTLPATVNIKDGLVVGDITPVALDNDILAALANSKFGEGDAAVGDVSWTSGEGHGLVQNLASGNEFRAAPFVNEINLDTTIVAGNPSSIPVPLYAQGYVDNVSEVIYISQDGTPNIETVFLKPERELIPAEGEVDANIKYFLEDGSPAEDTEDNLFVSAPLSENMKYYVIAGNSNPPAYNLASEEQIAAWGTTDEVELFVKLAKISAFKAGSYAVKAQGQKWDSKHVKKIGAGTTATSDAVSVPAVKAPSEITIDKSNPPINENDQNYSFDEVESANYVYLGGEGTTLTAKAVIDNEDIGALQFVWQKKDGENFSNIESEEPGYSLINEDTLNIEEEGTYKVLVKNFKNGEYVEATESKEITASPLAGKITSAVLQKKEKNSDFVIAENTANYNSTEGNVAGKVILKISDVVIDGQEGNLVYKWYKKNIVNGEAVYTLMWDKGPEYTITSGEGFFLPTVENVYNGSIYTYNLSEIFVNDESND